MLNLPKLPEYYIDEIIKTALKEDINYIDVTTDLLLPPNSQGKARIIAKADGVLAGVELAMRVFTTVYSELQITYGSDIGDGQNLKKGDVIAEIEGNTAAILKAERTALNILSHMSGIATYTRKCVDAVKTMSSKNGVRIADTRKTLPGLRMLQKYAVLCGGGSNHRYNLSAAAMLKDNHIDAYGGITKAVKVLRERAGHMVLTEVEVRDLDGLREAISVGVDVIMLDNMDIDTMKQAVSITMDLTKTPKISKVPKLEASGNVTLENIQAIAETGIDIISIGALTHSAAALDISLVWA